MKVSILVALNKSISSRMVVNFLVDLPLCPDDIHLTLFHVFRKPASGEEMMGHKFMEEESERYREVLEEARTMLIENGFNEDLIEVKLTVEDFPTVSDGIIDQFNKGDYNMIVIGRKRMTKAEEFVLGDPSVKLVRSLSGTAIMVIKGK